MRWRPLRGGAAPIQYRVQCPKISQTASRLSLNEGLAAFPDQFRFFDARWRQSDRFGIELLVNRQSGAHHFLLHQLMHHFVSNAGRELLLAFLKQISV